MLLILRNEDKIRDSDQLDQLIKAQIPDPKDPKQKKLFEIVTSHLIHGPCGLMNPTSVCMENNKCSKEFPKEFTEETKVYENGYPAYSRPDNGIHLEKILSGKRLIVIKSNLIIKLK